MMYAQMPRNSAQVHPIHIHLDGFLAHFFGISPGFGLRGVFDVAKHAAVALASAARFTRSVLAFCSVTLRTFNHIPIIAHFLAIPHLHAFQKF